MSPSGTGRGFIKWNVRPGDSGDRARATMDRADVIHGVISTVSPAMGAIPNSTHSRNSIVV